MPKPEHVSTDKTRRQVWDMASAGVLRDVIARVVGIDEKTLRKHYRAELDTAAPLANAAVARSLFAKATSDTHPGAVAAAIFWLKTRAGWREPPQAHEHRGTIDARHEHKLAPELHALLLDLLKDGPGDGE